MRAKKFSTWLYAIASNLVRDRYRWRTRHPQVSLDAKNEATGNDFGESLPDHAPSPSETVHSEERAETVRRAVAALPKDLRLPLVLAEYEEKSHAEIGEILGCSAKAVEVRIYRARKELRVSLGKLLETMSLTVAVMYLALKFARTERRTKTSRFWQKIFMETHWFAAQRRRRRRVVPIRRSPFTSLKTWLLVHFARTNHANNDFEKHL